MSLLTLPNGLEVGPEAIKPLTQTARSFGFESVDAFKASIRASLIEPQPMALVGGYGHGYYYTQGRNGMDWRVFWSDKTQERIARIVIIEMKGATNV
jgi:hypothetical protein